jgi:hypothetical protein
MRFPSRQGEGTQGSTIREKVLAQLRATTSRSQSRCNSPLQIAIHRSPMALGRDNVRQKICTALVPGFFQPLPANDWVDPESPPLFPTGTPPPDITPRWSQSIDLVPTSCKSIEGHRSGSAFHGGLMNSETEDGLANSLQVLKTPMFACFSARKIRAGRKQAAQVTLPAESYCKHA